MLVQSKLRVAEAGNRRASACTANGEKMARQTGLTLQRRRGGLPFLVAALVTLAAVPATATDPVPPTPPAAAPAPTPAAAAPKPAVAPVPAKPAAAKPAAAIPAAAKPKSAYIAPIVPTPDPIIVPMQLDVGAFGGGTVFSTKNRLGLAHNPLDVPGNSGEYGVRAGWVGLERRLTVEGEVRDALYTLRSGNSSGHVLGFRVQGLWNFLPEAKVQPFAVLGIGEELLLDKKAECPVDAAPTANCLAIKTPHNVMTGIFGAGVRVPLTYRLAARVDAHWLLQQGRAKDDTAVPPVPATAISSNWEFQAGLAWTFGGPPQDSDKDGIPDALDKCPNEPEDKDGFEDSDGCPDLDNDGDGIPDDKDKCPNQAEDKDGFEDEDGCPDPDNDRDGIPDAQDKCPNQPETRNGYKDEDGCPDVLDSDDDGIPEDKDKCPHEKEDKDGFEDEDGCPDPDNDKDGILDINDKCPNQPETKNGLNDEDGCPDSLPPAAQRLLDEPIDMRFRGVDLVPGADDVFDPLLELLLEHEGVKMTIAVAAETDDPPGKATAEARAESVRKAFGTKGIDASRITCIAGPVFAVAAPEPSATKPGKHKAKPKKGAKSQPEVPAIVRSVSLRIL